MPPSYGTDAYKHTTVINLKQNLCTTWTKSCSTDRKARNRTIHRQSTKVYHKPAGNSRRAKKRETCI